MEESIQQYINKKIDFRNKKILNEIDEKQAKQYIGIIVAGAVIISGLSITALSLPIGLIIAELAAGGLVLKIRNCRKLDIEESRLKKEIKHLKELATTNDNKKEDNAKELISLSNLKEKTKEEYTKAKSLTFLSYGLTTIGIAATIVDPMLSVIVIPGIASNILAVSNEIKKYNKCEEIKRQIKDVNHNIDVLKIKEEYNINNKKISKETKKEEKVFGVTYEEFKKIYEDNKGFDVKYPNDKPKQFIKK